MQNAMNSVAGKSRVLGTAFLLQAITSLASGILLKLAIINPANINETMANIAQKPWLLRANILGEMATAAEVIFLGAILYLTLRRHGRRMALVAFGFYLLEAALLAASRIAALALIPISREFVDTGQPSHLQAAGRLAFEFMNSGYALLMLPFCLGAILFYYLLYKSAIIPRALSLWGLLAVLLVFIATLSALAGLELPFFVYFPYIPFEFAVGIWILAKGVNHESAE